MDQIKILSQEIIELRGKLISIKDVNSSQFKEMFLTFKTKRKALDESLQMAAMEFNNTADAAQAMDEEIQMHQRNNLTEQF